MQREVHLCSRSSDILVPFRFLTRGSPSRSKASRRLLLPLVGEKILYDPSLTSSRVLVQASGPAEIHGLLFPFEPAAFDEAVPLNSYYWLCYEVQYQGARGCVHEQSFQRSSYRTYKQEQRDVLEDQLLGIFDHDT